MYVQKFKISFKMNRISAFSMMQSQIPKLQIPNDLSFRKVGKSSSDTNTIMLHHSSRLRIAYQGVPGAYGEAAAMKACPNGETLQCKQFKDVMEAVESGWASEAVLPIENTIGGSVESNYDLLLRHSALHVVGEIHLFVDHCLLALPTASIHHLNSVFSHPQALAQCETSLNKLGLAGRPAENTAVAAQTVASRGIKENGAIASARAAELYGLHILIHKFQDQSNNITRFLRLAKTPLISTIDAPSKTSIIFTPNEGHQGLDKALFIFAETGIHLSKIKSRPLEEHSSRAVNDFKNGSKMYLKYVYFIDFEASVGEPRVQYALERIKELASYVRILGCYPMDTASCMENILI